MMIGIAFTTNCGSLSGFGGAGSVCGSGGGGGRSVGTSSVASFAFTSAGVILRILIERGGVGLTRGPSVGMQGVVGGSSGANDEEADDADKTRELRSFMSGGDRSADNMPRCSKRRRVQAHDSPSAT